MMAGGDRGGDTINRITLHFNIHYFEVPHDDMVLVATRKSNYTFTEGIFSW